MSHNYRHWLVQESELSEYPLDRPEIVIGRDPRGSAIILESERVSGQHARLKQTGTGNWIIEDLCSTNGTKINGRRLKPGQERQLQDGDKICIGDVRFTFRSRISDQLSKETTEDFEDLMHLPGFIIGRGSRADNKLTLDHPAISRRHAEVKKTDGRHVIRDLNSTNGTFVNGNPVRGAYMLQEGDEIQIGPYKLAYKQSGFVRESPVRGYRLDAVHLKCLGSQGNPIVQRLFGLRPALKLRVILEDVNLSIQPGEFVALVGGSGAGKSTLMNALSGFVPANEGQVFLNGENLYANFAVYRNILGYVPQDDIVHKRLTARSALAYTARLRLPDAGSEEIKQKIQTALEQVEMTKHADKLIRKLSGGQRKRVSIAAELLGDPKLFFLDEPTSGLDPNLEKKMMETLRQQADTGRTIVLVTHATANIRQCDHVAFMADGCLAYFGPPDEALKFFNVRDFTEIYARLTQSADSTSWLDRFHDSPLYRKYVSGRLKKFETKSQISKTLRPPIDRHASLFQQFRVLTRRYFELVCRDAVSFFTLLLVMPLIGLLLLIMANPYDLVGKNQKAIRTEIQQEIDEQWAEQDPNISDEQFSGTYTVVGSAQKLLFMFALSANLLGIFAAAYEIIKEEAIYRRERMVNLKILPYLLSKLTVLGIFALPQCILLLVVVGVKLRYPSKGIFLAPLVEMYITLLLATLSSISLGLCISAIVRSTNTVIYIILIVLFVQIIFAGAIFELPAAAKPISYLTTTRWTLEALGSTIDMQTLKDQSVSCVEFEDKNSGETKFPCKKDQLKQAIDFTFHVNYNHKIVHLITRWLALLGFALIFGRLTLFIQKRKDVI